MQRRHQLLIQAFVAAYNQTAPLTLETEPQSTNNLLRADIYVCGAAAPVENRAFIDVTVANLASGQARSLIKTKAQDLVLERAIRASQGEQHEENAQQSLVGRRDRARELAMAVLNQRAINKEIHYREAKFEGTFFPLVISAGGLLHPLATKALAKIRKHAPTLAGRLQFDLTTILLRSRSITFRS